MKRRLFKYILFFLIIHLIPCIFFLSPAKVDQSPPAAEYSQTISVYFTKEDKVKTVSLEDYLVGVVSAEMPVSFPLEALKAQAVASRSYILDKQVSGGDKIADHKGAAVCTDSAHCKAWISKEDRFKSWPEKDAEKNWKKITAAVNSTAGEYMTYNGEPITAVFYAISSGTTERAVDVWGGDVPYLQNADSSHDKNAPGYSSQSTFSSARIKSLLKEKFPDIKLSKNPSEWYSEETRSSGGAVLSCKFGNMELKGTEVRTLFSLRSHNYRLSFKDDTFTFDVVGYGHGVGMSQWGAKFYADEGKSYHDILRIYYKDIEFVK